MVETFTSKSISFFRFRSVKRKYFLLDFLVFGLQRVLMANGILYDLNGLLSKA